MVRGGRSGVRTEVRRRGPPRGSRSAVNQALAQLGLLELSCRGSRDLIDERKALGQLPVRVLRPEMVAQLLGAAVLAFASNDDGQRSFAPSLVGDRDHRGFRDRWMIHQQVLEID